MNSMKLAFLLTHFLYMSIAFSEETPPGETVVTRTREYKNMYDGSISKVKNLTYYDINGNPIPMSVGVTWGPMAIGCRIGNNVPYTEFSNGSSASVRCYDTKAAAAADKKLEEDLAACQAGDKSKCVEEIGGMVGSEVPKGSSGGSSGTTGEVSSNQSDYDKKEFALKVLLYGANEIGTRYCVSAGEKLSKPLADFWKATKKYEVDDKVLKKLLTEKVSALNLQMNTILSNKVNKEFQVQAIKIQIELIELSLNSLSGGLLAADGKYYSVMDNRRTLKASAAESLVASNETEVSKNDHIYNKELMVSVMEALKKAEIDCEKAEPIQGCQEAKDQLSSLQAGPLKEYWDEYKKPEFASQDLNKKLGMLEAHILTQLESIPRTFSLKIAKIDNDGNVTTNSGEDYDWSSKIIEDMNNMSNSRIQTGVLCPKFEVAESKPTEESKSITKSLTEYLNKEGIVGEEEKEIKGIFVDSWAATDLVLGQPLYRMSYYLEFDKRLAELETMDRKKISLLTEQRNKLAALLTQLQNQLGNSPDIISGKGTSPQEKNKVGLGLIKTEVLSTEKNTAPVADLGTTNTLERNESISFSMGDDIYRQQLSAKDIIGSGSATKFTSSSLQKNDIEVTGNALAFAHAKKTSRLSQSDARKEKISNGYSAIKSTMEKQPFSDKFTKSIGKSFQRVDSLPIASYSGLVQGSIEGKQSVNDLSTSSYETKLASMSPGVYEGYNEGLGGMGRSFEGKHLMSGNNSSSTAKIKNTELEKKAKAKEKIGEEKKVDLSGDISKKDAIKLSQSIEAKKRVRKEVYEPNEQDTLFGRVTKAYIRNYEKVNDLPATQD